MCLFFIYYIGDRMQISFNEIDYNNKIIDIRTSLEYGKKHYFNSVNIPRLILLKNPEKYLNKKNKYYLLCEKGKISLICSNILNALGYKCYSIIGGIEQLEKNNII